MVKTEVMSRKDQCGYVKGRVIYVPLTQRLSNPLPSASSLFPSSQVFHDSQLPRSRPHVTLAADQENNHLSKT
jgi:hypothetical protein